MQVYLASLNFINMNGGQQSIVQKLEMALSLGIADSVFLLKQRLDSPKSSIQNRHSMISEILKHYGSGKLLPMKAVTASVGGNPNPPGTTGTPGLQRDLKELWASQEINTYG
jgi:hypothetical protein